MSRALRLVSVLLQTLSLPVRGTAVPAEPGPGAHPAKGFGIARWWARLAALVWVLGVFCGLEAAEARRILLRNGVLTNAGPAGVAQVARPQANEAAVSGLFLVQFTGRVLPEWRATLEQAGVEFQRFLPEDAFVVRLRGVRLSRIQSQPFVHWVGPYLPKYKTHSSLRPGPVGVGADGGYSVKILCAPEASAGELASVRNLLARVVRQTQTRFGAVFEGQVELGRFQALTGSDAVLWVEPASKPKLYDEIAVKIVGGDDGERATPSVTQALGFDGKGVVVAVADSGLDTGEKESMHPDLAGRVDAFFFYGNLEDASDEHSHGTHVTGIVAGNGATGEVDDGGFLFGLGVAPGAHIVAQRIFDGAGNYEAPPSSERLTRDAVRAGAHIGSNSWGDDTQGNYDISAAEFDALVRDADAETPGDQPYILEFSAGNAGPGPQTIGSPAVAKNVIASGAAQNNRFEFPIYAEGLDTMADFSSRGPCADGRIKPDVVAPGTWIASTKSQFAGTENAWAEISENYIYQGGTSQSGPHVSGAAAVFVQYYRETHGGLTPSPAMVKAALINSAVDMGVSLVPGDEEGEEELLAGDTGPVPNMDEGWGRVDLEELIASDRRFEFLDQTQLLKTGGMHERRVFVASRDVSFKATLVYTDVPGLPSAIPALVNDLDLEVVAPDGRVFRGNQFFEGESVANLPVGDSINNVEGVHVAEPSPGEWVVRVRGVNVVEDAFRRNGVTPEQDFALVISADIPLPGAGILFFDREAYRAPTQAQLRLIDFDLAGQPGVTVSVASVTEPTPEPIRLLASGTSGVFTGAVAVVVGEAVADGRIQAAAGDKLTAIYRDASPAAERVAEAVVDITAPLITAVVSTNRFGRATVEWTTDEPADSVVWYGEAGQVAESLTNVARVVSHRITLPPLIAQRTYQFFVVSTDAAGNTSTNDNGGRLFSFVAVEAKPLLLVYANDDLLELPPIESYLTVLDQIGIEYETWDLLSRPSPTAEDLKPFRAVIWRAQEFNITGATMTPAMTAALTSYVTNGGSLFMASMELLSRLTSPGDQPFIRDILHVSGFTADAGATVVSGLAADVISDGMQIELNFDEYPDLLGFINFPSLPDTLSIGTNAAPIFRDPVTGGVLGLRYPKTGSDSPGRVVYLGFALESVPLEAMPPHNRATLLANILNFLVPGLSGSSSLALDSGAYTVPASMTIEVTDTRRSSAENIEVSVSGSSDLQRTTIRLNRTPRPGVFRGVVTLVPLATSAAPGRLRAQHGDIITAEYVDPISSREWRAFATIDTKPPEISRLESEPEYNEATVRWATSKPSDALVQFGESPGDPAFLTRTSYSPDLGTDHELLITGLLPDREYYYRIVSRDEAGNTAIDDNKGELYTFKTLKPLTAPWSDDFEEDRPGWVSLNDETAVDDESGDSLLDAGWAYGTPRNELATEGHSGKGAWGTNLEGNQISLSISDLVSPAIDLSGGNRARLTFWHQYDFQERSEFLDIEAGLVAVTTNNGASWQTVFTVEDELSFGWEQVEVDLTPFAGKVIRIGWHYELFSFDAVDRPGWIIDDVAVSVTNIQSGTITITNNLSQASFTLTGPATFKGAGVTASYTNAPVGEYVLRFDPVAFYTTPAAQTNTLTANGRIQFQGAYVFPDANSNGVADAWETEFLGGLLPMPGAPGADPAKDSDGDGATDVAEFIAGTHPASASSTFHAVQPEVLPNKTVRLQWPSVAGRSYRIHGSTNLVSWTPYSDWLRANGTTTSITLPPLNQSPNILFRLEVRP